MDSAAAPATSSVLRLEADGSDLSGLDDDVEIVSATDSNYSGGAAGVSGYDDSASARIDDWEGGNLGGESASEIHIDDSYWVQEILVIG